MTALEMASVWQAIPEVSRTLAWCSGLVVLLSVPLALRRVPRNALYGFRTSATLRTDTTWYDANARAGKLGVAYGALFLGAALIAPSLVPHQRMWIVEALFLVGLVAGVAALTLAERRRSVVREGAGSR